VTVREVFEAAVAAGFRRSAVTGATDAQINAMAAVQGVARVPGEVREVLRIMGVHHGLWLMGSSLGVHLDRPGPVPGLVLAEHQGYVYHFVAGSDLGQDDPPVWVRTDDEPAVRRWDSVSSWFADIAPDVRRYRERLAVMAEIGRRRPVWADDFD
jgi:hypothetical protein